MKHKIIYLFIPLFLFGCSKKAAVPAAFNAVAVTVPEILEIRNIETQTIALFTSKNFDKLDEMAKGFRESPERYSDGRSKLYYFYDALDSRDTMESDFTNHLQIFSEWVAARPASITARVALANEWIAYAWAS